MVYSGDLNLDILDIVLFLLRLDQSDFDTSKSCLSVHYRLARHNALGCTEILVSLARARLSYAPLLLSRSHFLVLIKNGALYSLSRVPYGIHICGIPIFIPDLRAAYPSASTRGTALVEKDLHSFEGGFISSLNLYIYYPKRQFPHPLWGRVNPK